MPSQRYLGHIQGNIKYAFTGLVKAMKNTHNQANEAIQAIHCQWEEIQASVDEALLDGLHALRGQAMVHEFGNMPGVEQVCCSVKMMGGLMIMLQACLLSWSK